MKCIAIQARKILPPKDDFLSALFTAKKFKPKNGDVVAISSKVLAIDEGACVVAGTREEKEKLAKKLAERYVELPYGRGRRAVFTVTNGVLIRTAGIDESNGNGHFILWPKDPKKTAQTLKRVIEKKYKVTLVGVIITDSYSVPLRRGALGFALAWAGIHPTKDYRGKPDVFGRKLKVTLANIVDAIASTAVLVMGEAGESTPVVIIRDLKNIQKEHIVKDELDQFPVRMEDDIFSTFLLSQKWKDGGGNGLGK
jgi:dihydrofolate synthase / folylpolyglutamate synthase